MEYETNIGGIDITIEYVFEPAEEQIWTSSNGDPGTPGSAASVEIISIWKALKDNKGYLVNVDIKELFEAEHLDLDMDLLEEQILELIE
jgi:hypothetical protein